MQRQLQLRIEAQGKYLKKIIEEQQRLSETLAEVPGCGDSGSGSDKCLGCPDSLESDPATPAASSESPLGKNSKECAVAKTLSLDASFSSQQEPLTPDSTCFDAITSKNCKDERSVMKPCMTSDEALSSQEMVFTQQMLESTMTPSFQQGHPIYVGDALDRSALLLREEDQTEKL